MESFIFSPYEEYTYSDDFGKVNWDKEAFEKEKEAFEKEKEAFEKEKEASVKEKEAFVKEKEAFEKEKEAFVKKEVFEKEKEVFVKKEAFVKEKEVFEKEKEVFEKEKEAFEKEKEAFVKEKEVFEKEKEAFEKEKEAFVKEDEKEEKDVVKLNIYNIRREGVCLNFNMSFNISLLGITLYQKQMDLSLMYNNQNYFLVDQYYYAKLGSNHTNFSGYNSSANVTPLSGKQYGITSNQWGQNKMYYSNIWVQLVNNSEIGDVLSSCPKYKKIISKKISDDMNKYLPKEWSFLYMEKI
jgi:hypothetical protein